MSKELTVHVLFRFSKKTGNIDTTLTSLGSGMLRMWALSHTTKTKVSMIVERDTGNVILIAYGRKNYPKVKENNLGTVDKYGIPIEEVQSITDDRFDK